jgi:MarR family transcriptional regulator for hemolysin
MSTARQESELEFIVSLSTSSRKMQTAFDSLLRQKGLTLARARAMLHIARNPGVGQSELAKFLAIESPTLVRLLDGLEKQGLIRRSTIEGDRRAKQLSLTELAQGDVRQIEDLTKVVGSFMLRGVEADELAIAVRVLDRVFENIETAMGGHAAS